MNNPNWFIRLAYDGTAYSGWQYQPDKITVQGQLRSALTHLYQSGDFELIGSSRTDAGVHALDQWVTFRPNNAPPIPCDAIRKRLASSLPIDIRVQSVEEMPERFHARYSNCGKAYTYLIYRGRLNTPFTGRYVWSIGWDLDSSRMQQAADQMIGEHDFAGFTVKLSLQDVSSTMRCLNAITFREYDHILAVTIVGSSFLYKMVRRIMGYLVDVGRGEIDPAVTSDILAEGDGCGVAYKTAPPQGLFLERVFFNESELAEFTADGLPFMKLM